MVREAADFHELPAASLNNALQPVKPVVRRTATSLAAILDHCPVDLGRRAVKRCLG